MKTAISIPDDLFRQVELRAAELKMNRSEFFSAAVTRYLRQLEEESVTAAIDDAIARLGAASSRPDDEFLAYGRRRLSQSTDGDDW